MSNHKRETLKEANAVLIKSLRNGNEAIILEPDGFKLYAMNHYYAGYALLIDGVGYEFMSSIKIEDIYRLMLEDDLKNRGEK